LRDHGLEDSGVHLLEKPFTREQIGRRVREVLDLSKPFSPRE
jgi:hypothetical protein